MITDKVAPHHLERKAILYLRQSSAYQVLHNRESGALQYAMRDRLTALGFIEIEVIDEDLGRSAAGGVQRAGFERMVAEVCFGKVGAVCAREVSRFARNSRDWQQLIEMCRVVDTVLVDQETIYAPRHGNDRLLLGLKGSLNEYELDLLRQRSLSARYAKARRGELVVAAPVGFVKAGDRYEKDPGGDLGRALPSSSILSKTSRRRRSGRHRSADRRNPHGADFRRRARRVELHFRARNMDVGPPRLDRRTCPCLRRDGRRSAASRSRQHQDRRHQSLPL